MVELFSNLAHTQTVLPSSGGSLNLVRKGVAENITVGQGRTLCCSHISLMFVHLFQCTEIRNMLTDGTPDGICKNLTHQYQFLKARGIECYQTVMNILNHGKTEDIPKCSMMNEIFTLINEAMPNQKLVCSTPESDCSRLVPVCELS